MTELEELILQLLAQCELGAGLSSETLLHLLADDSLDATTLLSPLRDLTQLNYIEGDQVFVCTALGRKYAEGFLKSA